MKSSAHPAHTSNPRGLLLLEIPSEDAITKNQLLKILSKTVVEYTRPKIEEKKRKRLREIQSTKNKDIKLPLVPVITGKQFVDEVSVA